MREESPHRTNNFSIKNAKMYNKNNKIRDTTMQRYKEDDKERNSKSIY